jgi:hypothetical protein
MVLYRFEVVQQRLMGLPRTSAPREWRGPVRQQLENATLTTSPSWSSDLTATMLGDKARI